MFLICFIKYNRENFLYWQTSINQGSLEDLDRKAIQVSIFDIPKWAHLQIGEFL